MRRHFLLLLFLFIPALSFPQTTEPEEPEIVLPSMMLEIKDISVHTTDHIFMGLDELEISSLEGVLPGVGEFILPEEAFEILVPDQPLSEGESGTGIFGQGSVGAGLRGYILGEIFLYKIGQEPGLNLTFHHDRMDGFGSHPAGQGFFKRESELMGILRYQGTPLSWEGSASYNEREDGLQGLSPYFSLNRREVDGHIALKYPLSDSFKVGVGMEGAYLSHLLIREGTPRDRQFSLLNPSVFLEYDSDRFGAELTGEYHGWNLLTPVLIHDGGMSLSLRFDLPLSFTLRGAGGFRYTPAGAFKYPWSIEIEGRPAQFLSFKTSAGFRFLEQDLFLMLNDFPLLYPETPISDAFGLQVTGDIALQFSDSLSLAANAAYYDLTGLANLLIDSPHPGTELLPFEVVDKKKLPAEVSVSWSPVSWVTLTGETAFHILDVLSTDDRYSFSLSAEFGESRFGGKIGAGMSSSEILPVLNAEAWIEPTAGVEIILEGTDLLSIGVERTWVGDYIKPGATVILKTRISL